MSLRTTKSGAGRCTLVVDEARDIEEGMALSFNKMETVEIENGQKAAVVVFTGQRTADSHTTDEAVLVAIAESHGAVKSPGDLVDSNRDGFSRSSVYQAVRNLEGRGMIEKGKDKIRIMEEGRVEAVRLGAVLLDDEPE